MMSTARTGESIRCDRETAETGTAGVFLPAHAVFPGICARKTKCCA
jgi:hypothetical protein